MNDSTIRLSADTSALTDSLSKTERVHSLKLSEGEIQLYTLSTLPGISRQEQQFISFGTDHSSRQTIEKWPGSLLSLEQLVMVSLTGSQSAASKRISRLKHDIPLLTSAFHNSWNNFYLLFAAGLRSPLHFQKFVSD